MANKPKRNESTTRSDVKPSTAPKNPSDHASRIDEKIASIGGWRADTLAEIRRLIHEAVPGLEEDCKWIKPTNPLGVPTWSCRGILCTGEIYKQSVKLTFARGASLNDSHGLFNASLEGSTRRAIDIREGESIDAEAFKDLIQQGVAENQRSATRSAR